jgi:hypothetical protein
MTCPWEKYLYKPLIMVSIVGYPNTIHKETNKWLPKFLGNNVVTTEKQLYVIGRDTKNEEVEHEDVAKKFLSTSLTDDDQRWFKGFPENHLATYEYFSKLFKNRRETKKDNKMLMTRLNQIKKKEMETVSEFDDRFDKLHS